MRKTNIICLGFYDDFARFFLALKKELKAKEININYTYLSLYISGWLYFILRFNSSSFFSFKSKLNLFLKYKYYKNILELNSIDYKNINLNKVIKYHLILDSSSEVTLKLLALSYIDVINKLMEKLNPKLLILSGDSRMSAEIFKAIGKIKNVPILYFEQGPFKTTILDFQGVNANCSFRDRKINYIYDVNVKEKREKVTEFFNRNKSPVYFRNPFYRGVDYLFQLVFRPIGLYPEDTKIEQKRKVTEGKYKNLLQSKVKKKKSFLLILQVPFDANMVYHSPFFSSNLDIVKNIFYNLPIGYNLIIREHPLYKGRYKNELYDFMFHKNIPLDLINLKDSISNAEVVVVNNSTVGIEAISKYKPVVVLGNSYYDHESICLKLKNKKQLNDLLIEAISFKTNKDKVIMFLYDFLYNFLIDGHFRDKNLKIPSKIISANILKYFNDTKNL